MRKRMRRMRRASCCSSVPGKEAECADMDIGPAPTMAMATAGTPC